MFQGHQTSSALDNSPFLYVKCEPQICSILKQDILAIGPDYTRFHLLLKITLLEEKRKNQNAQGAPG